jgi:hypothetical protein
MISIAGRKLTTMMRIWAMVDTLGEWMYTDNDNNDDEDDDYEDKDGHGEDDKDLL